MVPTVVKTDLTNLHDCMFSFWPCLLVCCPVWVNFIGHVQMQVWELCVIILCLFSLSVCVCVCVCVCEASCTLRMRDLSDHCFSNIIITIVSWLVSMFVLSIYTLRRTLAHWWSTTLSLASRLQMSFFTLVLKRWHCKCSEIICQQKLCFDISLQPFYYHLISATSFSWSM